MRMFSAPCVDLQTFVQEALRGGDVKQNCVSCNNEKKNHNAKLLKETEHMEPRNHKLEGFINVMPRETLRYEAVVKVLNLDVYCPALSDLCVCVQAVMLAGGS